jgi:hypothetical protein
MTEEPTAPAGGASVSRFLEGCIVDHLLSRCAFEEGLPQELDLAEEPLATKEKTCKNTKPPCCKTTDTKAACCQTEGKTGACCEATQDSSPHCCIKEKKGAMEGSYDAQRYLLV